MKHLDTLIPLSDYVINLKDIETIESFDKIVSYTEFLKQPLKLEMFVPVGENGEILEEPKDYFEWKTRTLGTSLTEMELNIATPHCLEYQKAMSKVLFEGFNLRTSNLLVCEGDFYLLFEKGKFQLNEHHKAYYKIVETVEDIAHLGLKLRKK